MTESIQKKESLINKLSTASGIESESKTAPILRGSAVIGLPLIVLFITFYTGSVLFFVNNNNPIPTRIARAVGEHFKQDKKAPISLFHNNIFLIVKKVAKGEKLTTDCLVRTEIEVSEADPAKIKKIDHKSVVGSIAAKDLQPEHLVADSDLEKSDQPQDANTLDKGVSPGRYIFVDPNTHVMLIQIWYLAFLIYLPGAIWIRILAFKKSRRWGFLVLVVPFASTVFKIKNWEKIFVPFCLELLSIGYMGFCIGGTVNEAERANTLSDKLIETCEVLFVTRDVPEDYIIEKNALEVRTIPVRKTPVDALSRLEQAAGHKAKYGIASESIVSETDVEK